LKIAPEETLFDFSLPLCKCIVCGQHKSLCYIWYSHRSLSFSEICLLLRHIMRQNLDTSP